MKKILLVVDGNHFPMGAFEFIKGINRKQPVVITGVFLPPVEFTELLYSVGGISGPIYVPEVNKDAEDVIQRSVDLLWSLCKENGIECHVHSDAVESIVDDMKKESRYADLLVMGNERFYANMSEADQHGYIEDVLHKMECPVVLVPEKFSFPDSIIVAYDGSASSVYALKQFAYLFPELSDLKTTLVYASIGTDIPDMKLMKELAKNHFRNFVFLKLDVEPEKYFETWLLENKNTFLVAGAYSRSLLSKLMKKSFVDSIIHNHVMPVFVAHK